MTIPERPPKLSCHQQDMYELQRKLVLAERELELLKECTKDCYPREFVEWCIELVDIIERAEVDYYYSVWSSHNVLGFDTLDELFIYWKEQIK